MFRAARWSMRTTLFVTVIGAAAVLGACGDASDSEPAGGSRNTDDAGLQGTTWELDRSASTPSIPDGGTITLRVDPDSISGVAACNNYFGQFTLDGAALTLSPLGSTNMACVEGMEAEQAYLAALEKVDTVEQVTARRLVLTGDGVTLTFAARRPGTAIGGTWEITSINTGTALESPVNGTEPTITFEPDGAAAGTVIVDTGCNTITSTYRLEGSAISFEPGTATEMACPEPAGLDAQERALAAALDAATQVELGQILTLFDDAGHMVVVAAPPAG